MFKIDNGILSVTVNTKGGELDTVFSKETALDYLWNGDPAFWNKKSPVLFPIVGTLKENKYVFNGKTFNLSRHGFARDKEFTCTTHDDRTLTMTLHADEETLKHYPFLFVLDIIYLLNENQLNVTYRITNPANASLFFSIGGHPAFRIPLEKGILYNDYYLEFLKEENAPRWLISKEGLIEPEPVRFLTNSNILPVSKELFLKDAIVFKHLNSDIVRLKTNKSPHGIEFSFRGFPYLGLWAAPQADFVCIEPWYGIADSTQSNHDFISKEGIQQLPGGQTFERTWSARFY